MYMTFVCMWLRWSRKLISGNARGLPGRERSHAFRSLRLTTMLIFYALEDRSPSFILALRAVVLPRRSTASCETRGRSVSLTQYGQPSQSGVGKQERHETLPRLFGAE
jgi:hypothetical protein